MNHPCKERTGLVVACKEEVREDCHDADGEACFGRDGEVVGMLLCVGGKRRRVLWQALSYTPLRSENGNEIYCLQYVDGHNVPPTVNSRQEVQRPFRFG